MILEKLEINFNDRRIICKFYEELEAIININSSTKSVRIKNSVRQECLLSPPLFNLFIEKAINDILFWKVRIEIGVNIGGILKSLLRFADYVDGIAKSKEDLHTAKNTYLKKKKILKYLKI